MSEKRLSLAEGSNESDMSELLEHQKQKIRKLTEQRNDEIEKYNAAQREYYELVQKSDRVSRILKYFWWIESSSLEYSPFYCKLGVATQDSSCLWEAKGQSQ